MIKKKKDLRITVLCIILAVVMLGYSIRLFSWQILNREEYISRSLATTATYTSIPAARGEILDRYGRPLVENKESYNIVFNKLYLPEDKLNQTIITLTELLAKTGEKWIDSCPITKTAPYSFADNDIISSATMISELNLAHYATAQNCVDAMYEQFELNNFSEKQKRTIMGIRLTMIVADYADTIPYIFAEDVSLKTVTKIEEASATLPGVEIETVTSRDYSYATVAPHILGVLGPIYAEEWDDLKDHGYSYNDLVGKSGIESYAENYLKGRNGTKKTVRNSTGDVISSEVYKEAESGNTVVLTIDKELQTIAQNSLRDLIGNLRATKDGVNANAGAIVVMDVNNFEVLASATYPTYDIKTYKDDYDSLLNDPLLPLFNRAFNGVYAPGSTFKPATAAIGLQTGIISEESNIYCSHTYTYYQDYQPSCMQYHGDRNVVNALEVSCNYFFYDIGRRIGITKMNEYCKKLGLGLPTGIELSEASGILAGQEYRDSIGTIWNDGDTLQAAIGQSDNGFTPLQMAAYISSLANGGTRYKAHLIKEIRSYALDSVVVDDTPTVLNSIDISQDNIDIVKKGMLSVTSDGSVASLFAGYDVEVGGKTGTATVIENGIEYSNGVFVAFAPYEKPEIAIVTIVEKGGFGSTCAPPTKEILDAYFNYSGQVSDPKQSGKLIY